MALTDIYNLSQTKEGDPKSGGLYARLYAATLVAAVDVLQDAGASQALKDWAKLAVRNPDPYVPEVLNYVLGTGVVQSVKQAQQANDTAIQSAISAAVVVLYG